MTQSVASTNLKWIALSTALIVAASATFATAQPRAAAPGDCSQPMAKPITQVKLPAGQRSFTPTRDGCWVFITFVQRPESPVGLGVYRRNGETFDEVRFVPVLPGNPNQAFGLALTHDQKILVLSHFRQITFYDVEKLTTGTGEARLGQISGDRIGYSFGVTITPDDKYAFVAQGQYSSIAVIDLEKGRASNFAPSALIGVVPMGYRPSTTALSPDGQYLYSASKLPPDVVTPTLSCLGGKQPEGVVSIIDVKKATTAPASATIGFATPAGCDPTIVNVSPDGTRMYTVAAGDFMSTSTPAEDNSLVAFDTRPLREGKAPTLIGKVPVSRGPTSVVDTGSRIVIGSIAMESKLTVVDPARLSAGKSAIIGGLPVSATGLMLMADGHTIMGVGTELLAIIDLARVTPEPLTTR